jgi:hypothetical protein
MALSDDHGEWIPDPLIVHRKMRWVDKSYEPLQQ